MDKQAFILKPSRLAFVFQWIIFLFISVVLYQLVNFLLWGACMLLGIAAYTYCRRSPAPRHFQHLDQREWTLKHVQQVQPKHVSISHVIDHQLYIVVYFQHFKEKPLLIWCDQVTWQDWKRLKALAKLV